MKTSSVFLVLAFTLTRASLTAQNFTSPGLPLHLPAGLSLDTSRTRSYNMTTDYCNYDIHAKFINKSRVSGRITYGPGNSATWKDVYISSSGDQEAPFPQGTRQDYMQNFTYKPGIEIMSPEFFAGFPDNNIMIKNLFWDMTGFDVFAYLYWDSLELNREYRAVSSNSEVEMAGIGTFENKDIRITWIGITEMNGETCAIMKYSAMNNPLKVELEDFSLIGRSHYWGEVYVSLSDKQIEYATLSEDVLTDVKMKSVPDNLLGYSVRSISVVRIN